MPTKDGFLNTTLTKKDLAAYIGTTYETTFRILTELSNEELIELDEKKILIKSKVLLERLLIDNQK